MVVGPSAYAGRIDASLMASTVLPVPRRPDARLGDSICSHGLVRNLSYFPEPADGGQRPRCPAPPSEGRAACGPPPPVVAPSGRPSCSPSSSSPACSIAVPSQAAVAHGVHPGEPGRLPRLRSEARLPDGERRRDGRQLPPKAGGSTVFSASIGADRRLVEPGRSARSTPSTSHRAAAPWTHDRGHRLDPGHVAVVPH